MKRFRAFLLSCSVLMLIGCGPTQEDAKKLGFESVDEMKRIQALGHQTKFDWINYQTVVRDFDFAKAHGFANIDELRAYQAASPSQKLVISSRNAIKLLPYDEFIKCGGTYEAFIFLLYSENNKPIPESFLVVRGMYGSIKEAYVAEGKSEKQIENDLLNVYLRSVYERNIDQLDKSSDQCLEKYKPYFVAKVIDEYKVGQLVEDPKPISTDTPKPAAQAPIALPPAKAPEPSADISILKRGLEYNFYADGSCKENCLTKNQAEKMCGNVYGYSQYMFDLLTNGGLLSERDRTVLQNTTPSFSASWNGRTCRGRISSNGMYKGSSARVEIEGSISSFYIKDNGQVLASYLDTLR